MRSVEEIRASLRLNPRREVIQKILPRLLAANSKPSDGPKPFLEVFDRLNEKFGKGDPAVKEELLTFFSSYKDRYYLEESRSEEAVVIVAEAMNEEPLEKLAWAAGASEPKAWQKIGFLDAVREILPPEKQDALVKACAAEITSCCQGDRVISPNNRYGGKVTKESFKESDAIERYWSLAYRHLELIHHGLFHGVGHMIEFLAHTWKGTPDSLMKAWDHPAIQARFGTEYGQVVRKRNAAESVDWIQAGASEMTIAIACIETLQTILHLEREAHELKNSGNIRYQSTSFDIKAIDLFAEKPALLRSLAQRLAVLPSPENLLWIGSLLSKIESIFPRARNEETNDNLTAAEEALEESAAQALIADPLNTVKIDKNIASLRQGLQMSSRRTTLFHLYDIGSLLQKRAPEIHSSLLLALLDDYREQLQSRALFHVTFDIYGAGWTRRLVAAGCQLHESGKLNFEEWFMEQLRPLPLSLWDFEEGSSRFISEHGRTRHLLLTAAFVVCNLARKQNVEKLADIVLDKGFSYWRTVLEVSLLRHGNDMENFIKGATSLVEIRPERQKEYSHLLESGFPSS